MLTMMIAIGLAMMGMTSMLALMMTMRMAMMGMQSVHAAD